MAAAAMANRAGFDEGVNPRRPGCIMPSTRLRVQACVTHDIFISFSTRDRLVAESLKRYMDERGMSCWMSAAAIDGGEVWTRAIVDGITGARAMVLILSASSNASEHVRREIYLARERHLRIIPFRIDSVEPDGDLAYNLAGIQWIEGSAEPTDTEFERLAQSVRGYLSRTAAAAPAAESTAAPMIEDGPFAAEPVEPATAQVAVASSRLAEPPAAAVVREGPLLGVEAEPPPPASRESRPEPALGDVPPVASPRTEAPSREHRATSSPLGRLGDELWKILPFIGLFVLYLALKYFAPF